MHRQLYGELSRLILSGKLKAGTRLPSSRSLADDMGISRNTIIAAYDALLAEGYIESRSGSGTTVSSLPAPISKAKAGQEEELRPQLSRRGEIIARQPKDQIQPGRVAFHPGYPDIKEFPFATWSRLLRRYARYPHEDIFGYHSLGGHPRLQAAIAAYLGVSRGVECDANQVIIVTGAQAAFDLCARLLLDEGDTFCFEDPGYAGAYGALLAAGGIATPLLVDEKGWLIPKRFERDPRLFLYHPHANGRSAMPCGWRNGCAAQCCRTAERLDHRGRL